MFVRGLERFCTILNGIAAVWLILIALVILIEVSGRQLFNAFMGGDEIVRNSVPAIVFLQVPLAIAVGSMLRTTIVFDHLGKTGRHIINGISYAIGILFFVGIAIGGWSDMIAGWDIKEFEGIGALEVPVYPIRTIVIFSSILIVLIYGSLLLRAIVGRDTTPGAQGGATPSAEA